VDDSEIANQLASIQKDGAWPDIDYEDISRTGFEHRYHLSNMVALARTYYASEPSGFYRKEEVKQSIEAARRCFTKRAKSE